MRLNWPFWMVKCKLPMEIEVLVLILQKHGNGGSYYIPKALNGHNEVKMAILDGKMLITIQILGLVLPLSC